MQHQKTAFLAGLFLVLSSHFTIAAQATRKDVNRALASREPVVLVGVPAEFLHPETIEGDEIETQSDWDYYLSNWMEKSAKERKLKILIVPRDVLARTLQTPILNGHDCATLFVKNRTEGLLFDSACVIQFDDYEVGAKWLQGNASPHEIAESGSKTTAVVPRNRK